MSTYTQILYQIVFGTKAREKTLSAKNRPILFQYISGILEKKKCHLYRINGVDDHLHIITHLHPAQALAFLVKDIKVSSSKFIKEEELFPHFRGWQSGYAAFTYSMDSKDRLIEYVKNQEIHHQKMTSKDELEKLLLRHNIHFEEKYFE